MKKDFQGLILILGLFLTGCKDAHGQKMDLWYIPLILFVISLYLLYRAWVRRNSGSEWNDPKTGYLHTSNEKMPIHKIWQGAWGIGLGVISVIFWVAMYFFGE